MKDDEILVELRFSPNEHESLDISVTKLQALDIEVGDKARDPTLVAVLTVAAAATKLVVELIGLAKELRQKGKTREVVVVRLGNDNREKSINLLKASEDEIQRFLTD